MNRSQKLIYAKWFWENVPRNPSGVYGKCEKYSKMMLKEFPELILVRGHFLCYIWGEREHWWLKTQDGAIVDPTGHQFPSFNFDIDPTPRYKELDPNAPEPTGKCPNCGEYCYNGNDLCSKICETQFRAHLMEGI